MYGILATKKLLNRFPYPTEPPAPPSTSLGNWYANARFWRPQVAVLVNEATLLPLFLPLAPARTLGQRIPAALRELLESLAVNSRFVEHECEEMAEYRYSKTASRSVLASLNDFVNQASWIRRRHDGPDPLTLARELAHTPCRMTQAQAIWPDEEVRKVAANWLMVTS